MVTFKNDIHLGRRVPMTPVDERKCMFVSITSAGVATDKYGRQWQLTPYVESLATPTITIEDVTSKIFGDISATGAAYYITISSTDIGVSFIYKKVKIEDDTETESEWIDYTDVITMTEEGTWKIIAKAVLGDKVSAEATSTQFTITKAVKSISYGDIALTFNYAEVDANEHTNVSPTFSYTQVKTTNYTTGSPTSETLSNPGTYQFYNCDTEDEISDDTKVDSATIASVDASTSSEERLVDTMWVVITANGKTKTAKAELYQAGMTDPAYYIGYDADAAIFDGNPDTSSWYSASSSKTGSATNPITTIEVDGILGIKCSKNYDITVSYVDSTGANTLVPDSDSLAATDDTYNYYAFSIASTIKLTSITYTKK